MASVSSLKERLLWVPVAWTIYNSVFSFAWIDGALLSTSKRSKKHSQEVVLIDKLSQRFGGRIKRGEIVATKSIYNPRKTITSRLVAMEGDWIKEHGRVHRIPAGSCYLVDDDTKQTGTVVPLALLEGKATVVCWPPSQVGIISRKRAGPKSVVLKGGN